MTSNNEYYQDILRIVSGETISTYETTLNLMKRICLAYGCTYTDAQCSNKYLKDFAEASIGTTYSEPKLNIEYLHDIAVNFYPATVEGTENYYLSIIADYISVTPKLHTDLTIDVPLVLVYSDEFNITGVLTDENDDPVANATIELLIGNTIVGTATSNSQGQVSFTKSPVSMGNHTFQLRYNGDTGYYATTSSIVSRTINKETSVLNVSLPLDNANYYDYENIAVTGTLYDNDGDLIEGTSVVKVYNGSTLLESVNVSNGSFSISNLTDIAGTLGDYTLTIIYEGNDYYTASSITRTIHIVEEILYDDLTLTSTKSILSYYDTEYADLTAQLTYEGSDVAISGVAIDFYVDGVLKDTINTNNSGRSVYRYNSAGAGDVTIVAKIGTFVSETCVIEDCLKYFPLIDNTHQSAFTIPSGVTSQYSSNGWRISANAYKQIKLTDKLTSDCSVEFTLEDYYSSNMSSYAPVIVFQYTNGETTPNQELLVNTSSSSFRAVGTTINHAMVKGAVYRIEYTSSTIKIYEDDTLLASANNSVGLPTRFEWHMGANDRYAIYKDLKVKPL